MRGKSSMTNRPDIFRTAKKIVVKVGSGVLTKPDGLDRERVEALAAQICRLAQDRRQVVLVSSGAVASGRAKVGLPMRPGNMPEKQAAAALGQAGLVQAYEESFAHYGRLAAQILLTADDLTHRERYINIQNTFNTLLEWNVIPVVNENDTVSTNELRFGDNDNLAAMLTNLLGAELLINLTNVNGVLDGDPRVNPQARRIPLVEQVSPELLQLSSAQPGAVGMGGMFSKVRAAEKAARCGAHTIVANGLMKGILDRLHAGEDLGTLFTPKRAPLTSRKHWIAFTASQDGELTVDQGAVAPLTVGGKSLLAVGISKVRGSFPSGGTVRVLGPDQRILGVGISNYSSRELEQIKGLHSGEIHELLGDETKDEVIHRDNLAIFGAEEEENVACLFNR